MVINNLVPKKLLSLVDLLTDILWMVIDNLDIVSDTYLRNTNTFFRDAIATPSDLRTNRYAKSQILHLVWEDTNITLRMVPKKRSCRCTARCYHVEEREYCYICRCKGHVGYREYCGRSKRPRQLMLGFWLRTMGKGRNQHNYVSRTARQDVFKKKTIKPGQSRSS